MNQRLNYLDTAKGISIALVILGHLIQDGNSLLRYWIYSFHMPIFFIISGYLINLSKKDIPPIEFITRKFKALIIPYISFALINYFFIMYDLYSQQQLTEEVLITYLAYIIKLCGRSAIWFLPCLFISQVFFKLITDKVSNRYLRFIIISFLFIIPFFIQADSDTLLLVLLRSFTALGFIEIGYLLYKPIRDIDLNFFKLTVLFVINIALAVYNGPVDLFALKFNNIILYTMNSILGSLALIFLCKKLLFSKFLIHIGKNSLIIMGTHILIINLINIFFKNIIVSNLPYLYPSRYGVLLFFTVLLVELPIIFIFNNYLAFTLGKAKPIRNPNYINEKAAN